MVQWSRALGAENNLIMIQRLWVLVPVDCTLSKSGLCLCISAQNCQHEGYGQKYGNIAELYCQVNQLPTSEVFDVVFYFSPRDNIANIELTGIAQTCGAKSFGAFRY